MKKRKIYRICIFCLDDLEIDEGIIDVQEPSPLRIPYHYSCCKKYLQRWLEKPLSLVKIIIKERLIENLDYLNEEFIEIKDTKWNKLKINKFFK